MHPAKKAWMDKNLPIRPGMVPGSVAQDNAVRRIWLDAASIPWRYYEYYDDRWDNFKTKDHGVVGDIRSWIEQVQAGKVVGRSGVGLLLWGEPGQGKSTIACVALMDILLNTPVEHFGHSRETYQMVAGLYTPYASLTEDAKRMMSVPSDSDEWGRLDKKQDVAYARLAGYKGFVVVLDDVGKEYKGGTGWAVNNFDHLIRRRYDLGLPTIVTTNTDPQEWGELYGASMGSFVSEAFHTYPIVDRRGDRRQRDER